MAKSTRIRVMLSSRCNDRFPPTRVGSQILSEIRKELKAEIEAAEIFGRTVFEVWINEDAPAAPGSSDSWEHCLRQAREADVVIVLSNGNAGWAKAGGDLGICHAELMTALTTAPGKVRVISLGRVQGKSSEERERNKRFQDELHRENLFHSKAESVDELKTRVQEAIADALVGLAQQGVREASRAPFDRGQALDWVRLDFLARRDVMLQVLRSALVQRPGTQSLGENLLLSLGQSKVLFVPHAIPAALSVPQALEMVGQPFLRDFKLADQLKRQVGGPVHVIACQRTATENQATRLLGFVDATVVKTRFGIYVADNVQKIQFAFIANCRDETTTRHGVQRFLEWLEHTGEAEQLAARAISRAKIVTAIAEEWSDE
jgi:hypothetical protein